jgi:gliding motility associated protien GldN
MLACFATGLVAQIPLDDITNRHAVAERQILQHEIPHERDILWQKRVWRVLDVREKINLPFTYPEAPLFDLLVRAARSGELTLYSGEKDDFSGPLTMEELDGSLFRKDTVLVWLDDTNYETRVVEMAVHYEEIKRYRIKEMWYFDTKTSQLRVRILGIAPLRERHSEGGDFIGEAPLFWVHLPSAVDVLARERVWTDGNEAAAMTWADLFEMRKFSSYVTKEGNVRNNRLQDLYTGVDVLLEAEKIDQEIFNFEHDLWSY